MFKTFIGMKLVNISSRLIDWGLQIHQKAGKMLHMPETNFPKDSEISWVMMRTLVNGVNLFTMYGVVGALDSPEYSAALSVLPGEVVWAHTIEELRVQGVINHETRIQQLALLGRGKVQ
jgi:hypothetical protein